MISIITPTNDITYLNELYSSILDQTFSDWEWILVPNGPVEHIALKENYPDDRVKVFPFKKEEGKEITGVGELKYFACSKASGDIIAEVDHDDILTPDCLEEVNKAFQENSDACFVYSNNTHINEKFERAYVYSGKFGWSYRDFYYKGKHLLEYVSPEPYPQNLSRITFAPDHIRAWKAKDYFAIGGHDKSLPYCDDHDLVCRFALSGKIVHIDKCLYIYRIHGSNNWLKNIDYIQAQSWANHTKYITPLMMKWADERGLRKIDLCGGFNKPKGFESIDLYNGDITADLEKDWPLEDNSVGVLRASDALEHLSDPIHTMNEAYRVLAHGGMFFIAVPSTDGRGAFQDPTHISFWNQNSFLYYTEKEHQQYVPQIKAKFQVVKVETVFPNDYCKQNNISYVYAHLIAVKDGKEKFYGEFRF